MPAQFAGDPERLARFEQESRAAAALNHPGIAAIYDVGVEGEGADRTHYMVQEFLEGETLQDLLARGPVARKKALTLAAEIASALAVAHEAGIIHRDLKPANVFVTPSGNAKVLDFGLAKLTEMSAVSASGDNSMSPTVVGTMTGTIMGTAGYMAPEQVHGENVDRRADIFALGCVLYELLGGQRAFSGKSLPDTLAKILHEDPEPLTGLGPELDRLLEKCLSKEPAERYQHADDLVVDLRYLSTEDTPVTEAMDDAADEASGVSWLMVAAVAAIALLVGGLGRGLLDGAGAGGPGDVRAPTPMQLTEFSTRVSDPAVSPNGQMLAFIGKDPVEGWGQVYVKTLPDGPPLRLTNTPDHKDAPQFSPDGSRIAYTVVAEDWKWDTWSVSITGDEPRLMLRNGNALNWTADGGLIFAQYKEGAHLGIVRSDASGGNQEEIWFPPLPWQMAHQAALTRDGSRIAILYMGASSGFGWRCFVSELPVPDGEPADEESFDCGGRLRLSPDDQWLYYDYRDEEIRRMSLVDGAVETVTALPLGMDSLSGFDFGDDGRSLIFAAGTNSRNVWWRRADGTERQLTFEDEAFDPKISFDGRFAFYRQAGGGNGVGLWRYRLADRSREQICPGLRARDFVLARDGNRVVIETAAEDRGDLVLCHIDGSAPPRVLLDGYPRFLGKPVFSPDGETLYFMSRVMQDGSTISAIDIPTGDRREIATLDGNVTISDISPDGALLSIVRGNGVSNGWLLPVDGQSEPRLLIDGWDFEWSPDGSSFLFINDGMVSSAWELANSDGTLLPDIAPDADAAALAEAGAVRLMTAMGFARAAGSPRLYEAVYARAENRSNLFQIPLPE